MACEEKERLMAVHKKTLEKHTVSSNDLYMLRGRTSREEYNRLIMIAFEALTEAQITFHDLMDQIRKHAC